MKKNSLYQSLLSRLKNKHTKLASRFHRSVKEGEFQKLHYRKKKDSVERLKSLEKRISRIGSQVGHKPKLNYKHWAVALAMGVVVSAGAQETKKTFKQQLKRSANSKTQALGNTPLAASFGTIVELGVPYLSNFLTGDIDGDGDVDAIYVSYTSNPVILFNEGGFNFTTGEIPIGSEGVISNTVLDDFDGDGDLDFLAKEGLYGTNTISMWLNNGSGSFTEQAASISFGSFNPNDYLIIDEDQFLAANIDADSDLDLVIQLQDTVTYRNYIGVFENVSSVFTQTALIQGTYGPNPDAALLCLLDVDGDTDIDIAYMSFAPSAYRSLQVLQNDGTGSFTDSGYDLYPSNSISFNSRAAALDLDDDGDQDIVGFIYGASGLSTRAFINDGTIIDDGSSNFTESNINTISTSTSQSYGEDLFAIDIDGDNAEGFVANSEDSTWVFTSNGNGAFTEIAKFLGNSKPAFIDGDEDADLFYLDGNLSTLENQGGGAFQQNAQLLRVSSVYDVDLVDMDGDGDLDFVAAGTKVSRSWENDGNGNFTVYQEFDGDAYILEFLDLDADGDLDMLKADEGDGSYPGIEIWENEGGVFSYTSSFATGYEVKHMKVANLDADADLEIVAYMQFSTSNFLRTFDNNGNLTTTQIDEYAIVQPISDMDVGDIDGDTFVDVVLSYESYEYGVGLFLNDQAGNLSQDGNVTPGPGQELTDVDLADFDGDGDLDFLISRQNGNAIYFNDDTTPGTFPTSTAVPFADYAYKSFVGDADNDGDMDIVFGGYGSQPQIWENDGAGNFTFDDFIPSIADEYTKVRFGDVDGDGDLDFALGGYYAGTKIIFNNAVSIAPLEADALALTSIYDNMGGTNWDNAANWGDADVSTWFGVTLNSTEDRVERLELPNNGLTGTLPAAIDQLDALDILDLSDNDIDALATDFTALTVVSDINLNGNQLDFGDLEAVAGVNVLSYTSQQEISAINEMGPLEIPAGSNQTLTATASGSANNYQWTYEGQDIAGANGTSYTITDINRSNMGTYTIEVSNSLATGVTLTSVPTEVLATAIITANVTDADDELITENVDAYLLEIIDGQAGFDTVHVATQENISSSFSFPAVVLADYLVSVDADGELYVPSYYSNTFLWDEADTLKLNGNSTIQITMTETPTELTAADGEGVVSGTIEEDFGDDAARIDARRRAAKRKCGLRRKRSGGRTGQETDVYDLIAYGETNDDGEFEYGFLPQGTYRFFVEYPGIPLDESAFVQFDIGEAGVSDNSFKLAVFASEDGISIELVLGLTSPHFTDFNIYPNPTTDIININYKKAKSGNLLLEVVDLHGKQVLKRALKGKQENISIDISGFEKGQYIFRLMDESRKDLIVYKIIKN